MRKSLVGLVDLANRAKDVSQYALANAIMAFLIELFLGMADVRRLTRVLWETEDGGGAIDNEAYYDLIVVQVMRGGPSLCIPLPLVSRAAIERLAKVARICDRKEHNRRTREVEAGEVTTLWLEFEQRLAILGVTSRKAIVTMAEINLLIRQIDMDVIRRWGENMPGGARRGLHGWRRVVPPTQVIVEDR